MATESTGTYRFGDLLALARQAWVRAMEQRLAAHGFCDYRRSDAGALRVLAGGPRPLGALATTLGVTRQAARKVLDGLVGRGYASERRDPADSRRLLIDLTESGEAYAAAIVAAVEALNADVVARVASDDLLASDRVLRSILDEATRQRVSRLIGPPS